MNEGDSVPGRADTGEAGGFVADADLDARAFGDVDHHARTVRPRPVIRHRPVEVTQPAITGIRR